MCKFYDKDWKVSIDSDWVKKFNSDWVTDWDRIWDENYAKQWEDSLKKLFPEYTKEPKSVEKSDEFLVSVNLAGTKRENIELTLKEYDLILKTKVGEEFKEKYCWAISKEYDLDTLTSKYEDGLLTITAKKIAKKTRKVAIT